MENPKPLALIVQGFWMQLAWLWSGAIRGDLNWKIPKISASGRNFLDPLPLPSSKKGRTNETVGISYLREAFRKNCIFYDNLLISIATYPPYLIMT